jgi:hypothetical protein
MIPTDYFLKHNTIAQKQYEALRAFFVDKLSAKETAEKFGYTLRAFNSLVTDFRTTLKKGWLNQDDPFFQVRKKGRSIKKDTDNILKLILEMRKKNYSVTDIKTTLDSKNYSVSERYISLMLNKQGFARLPRRSNKFKAAVERPRITAAKSMMIDCESECFTSSSTGILLFLPYLEKYGIITAIAESDYPETNSIDRISSILAFQALKLNNFRRYSADDLWCMDRGLGLFAKLNVLPKVAWYSSYSHRITRDMNVNFLKKLHRIWQNKGLLGDTFNLDFVTVPYWGDDDHLENNWSGKRGKSLASMLCVLAQDPDSGIIDYGDFDIRHENEHLVVLEFLDFYKKDNPPGDDLKYLVFDSKFTNYQNLKKLDNNGVKFVTIRRRGKNLVEQINNIAPANWKKIRVMNADGKGRTLKANDQNVFLKGYDDTIRQIAITGHGKIKPALVITNEFDLKLEAMIRKYSRRWLVEKSIAEQTEFFHLNNISSSMVIKVDFDLTMTILAHNLYRLFAMDLNRCSHFTDIRLYEKFISNSGEITIADDKIEVKMKKKRDLPELLTIMSQYNKIKISWLGNKPIAFSGLSYS